MVREIQYTPTHIDYCDIAVSFSVHLQNYVLSTRCVNEVKRKRGFSKQTWKERVCVCLCVLSAFIGVFLIRASRSQFRLGTAGRALQPAASEQHPLKSR